MLPLMWQISIPSVILPAQNRKTEFSCDALLRFLSTEGCGNGIIESYAESELRWEDTLMTTWKRNSLPLREPLAPYDGLLRVTPDFRALVRDVFIRFFIAWSMWRCKVRGTVACLCWLLRKCLPCRTAYAFRRSFYRPSRWGRR